MTTVASDTSLEGNWRTVPAGAGVLFGERSPEYGGLRDIGDRLQRLRIRRRSLGWRSKSYRGWLANGGVIQGGQIQVEGAILRLG